ncbi:MAG: carbohydrate ABC transporter permease [Armatimonadota bacterium]
MRREEEKRRRGEEASVPPLSVHPERSRGARVGGWAVGFVTYLALTAVGLTMLVPFAWMISTSLKAPGYAVEFPPRWIPSEPEAVTIDGQTRRVVVVGGAFLPRPSEEVRAAVLRYSPEGVHVRVLSPADRAGEELVVPEGDLQEVRVVRLHWENYANAWRAQGVRVQDAFLGLVKQADGFLVFYTNSIFVTICVTLGTVFTSSLAAFAFSRMRFPGRDAIFLGYLATLMVPAIVIMLPVYALLSNLRLTNTYAALIFPPMFSAYGTFLLRQFFMTIPRELEDAAIIDGASPFGVYRHIILPLSKPALATLTTFVFLHSWNDFLWPLMVVDRLALKTLPIGLAHFQDSYTTDYHLLMAASVIVMIPVLIVFLIGQRYFVRGIALSGMKG